MTKQVYSLEQTLLRATFGSLDDIYGGGFVDKVICEASGGPCQFKDDREIPYFEFETKSYCIFHAPVNAVMVGNADTKKADFDVNMFNSFITQRMTGLSHDSESYQPTYKRSSVSTFHSAIIRYLEDHSGIRVGRTNFRGVIFPGDFSCRDFIFIDADFKNCVFHGECDFRNSTFKFRAFFSNCTFNKTASFANCKFEDLASFENCRFNARSGFEGASFSGDLDLSYAKTSMLHICCPSQSLSHAAQRDTKISTIDKLVLNNAEFGGMLCLRNRNLTTIELQKTIFKSAPVFVSTTVGDDVVFRNAEFLDMGATSLLNYTILKKIAMNCGDLTGAEKFRALEFLCQIHDKENVRTFSRLLISGYRFISRFGTDSLRPMILLIANTSIFTLFYYLYALTFYNNSSVESCWFSLRQIIQPFQFFDADPYPALGIFMHPGLGIDLVAMCQSLLTFVFVGLFLQSLYRVFNK